MPALSHPGSDPDQRIRTATAPKPRYRRVIACVDGSPLSKKVVPHALAVADALGSELTLVHVLEAAPRDGAPADPVEWDILRREAREHVERLASEHEPVQGAIGAQLLEGSSAEQICQCADDIRADLIALCTQGQGGARNGLLGDTARRVIASASGSILLVPATVEEVSSVHYRRILVPLDGSSRAESALPVAIAIAEAHQSELVLLHAVPEPELTQIGPFEAEDIDLRERVVRRNEDVAQTYLEHVRIRFAGKGVKVRSLIVRGGDVRRLLAGAVMQERADLVVMASHGHSGHADVAHGSVASYLISRATTPLLIVREHAPMRLRAREAVQVRLPDQAAP